MVRVGGGEDSVGGNESGDERGGESEYRIARERCGGGGTFGGILRLLEGLMGFSKEEYGQGRGK